MGVINTYLVKKDTVQCVKQKKIEHEFHFSFEYQHYQTIRNNTHNILKKIFQMNIQTE
mgnify:CR=1 FL=1